MTPRKHCGALGRRRQKPRCYGNFTNVIDTGASDCVRRSADGHIAWIRGNHGDLT